MTWQRIDENTYIDDTLVTCVEYQLFIDEMREQGKYYQPDHWTSYQFPNGSALEPILGVRSLDAASFCEWLTERRNGEWLFRLPIQKEAVEHPIRHRTQLSFGYWVLGINGQSDFIHTSFDRIDIRSLNRDQVVYLATTIDINLEENRTLDGDIERIGALKNALYRDLQKKFERSLAIERVLEHTIDKAFTQTLAHASDIALERAVDRALDRARNRALEFEYDQLRDVIHDFALDLFIDIYTLQERIAGRSPAFEGIRLVKERIR